MATPEELLAIVEDDVRKRQRELTPKERRVVIEYLESNGWKSPATAKDYDSNYRLADLFFVSEATIRVDKKSILKAYTKDITPAQALTFVGEYMRSHDHLIRRAERGLNATVAGSLGEQNYLRLISDLRAKWMKLLQEIGAVPKELGRLNVTEEHWVAEVSDDGITSLHLAGSDEQTKAAPASEGDEE